MKSGKLLIELKEDRIHNDSFKQSGNYFLSCVVCGMELFYHEEHNNCTCDYCDKMLKLDSEIKDIESNIELLERKG